MCMEKKIMFSLANIDSILQLFIMLYNILIPCDVSSVQTTRSYTKFNPYTK